MVTENAISGMKSEIDVSSETMTGIIVENLIGNASSHFVPGKETETYAVVVAKFMMVFIHTSHKKVQRLTTFEKHGFL
jgi:hypothetical protein